MDGAQTGGHWLTAPDGAFPAGPVDGGVGTLGQAAPQGDGRPAPSHRPQQVGAGAASPMTLLSEWVSATRALLNAETVTVNGVYVRLDEVSLNWPPTSVPPLLVGARGQKTLALAGQIADGLVLDAGLSPDGVSRRGGDRRSGQASRSGRLPALWCGARRQAAARSGTGPITRLRVGARSAGISRRCRRHSPSFRRGWGNDRRASAGWRRTKHRLDPSPGRGGPNHYPRCSRLTIYHASLRVADLDAEPGNVCTAGR